MSIGAGIRARARAAPLTSTVTGALGLAELGYLRLPGHIQTEVAAWASTNVHRLTTEPAGPMLASAFVVQEQRLLWFVLAGFGCAAVESRVGWRRTLLVVVSTHVTGTLVSEGVVWWRYHHGRLPASQLLLDDVGVSYIVVGLLVAAAVLGPLAVRLVALAALGMLAQPLLTGLTRLDYAAVGHLTAATAGAALAFWAGRNRTCRPQERIRSVRSSRTSLRG